MQKQKNYQVAIIGVLAFAVLFMAVGFAAYTQTLNINGKKAIKMDSEIQALYSAFMSKCENAANLNKHWLKIKRILIFHCLQLLKQEIKPLLTQNN